ncbi:MAG: hypothetical protein V8K32_05655 [Candidatus Electrothrix gigas]
MLPDQRGKAVNLLRLTLCLDLACRTEIEGESGTDFYIPLRCFREPFCRAIKSYPTNYFFTPHYWSC